MFNLINIELFPISYGPTVSGIVVTGAKASAEPDRQGQATPTELPVPWRDLQANPDVFSLLQWRTAISEFAGREAEMETLKAWAYSDLPISAKFMTGEGGVGKTRLAAELAMELRKDDWAAGFPDLRHDNAYFAAKSGTLLIVDYPEELPGGLESLFTGLARVEESGASRLRVLFLSRREPDVWRQLALDTNADAMIDWAPVPVGPLVGEAAYSVFHSALERAAEAEDTVPPPVSMEVLDAWLEHAPENDRALFIVAAALYCALHPDSPLVDYKGREVVTALVEREIVRRAPACGRTRCPNSWPSRRSATGWTRKRPTRSRPRTSSICGYRIGQASSEHSGRRVGWPMTRCRPLRPTFWPRL